MIITLNIKGEPKAQPRAKASRRGNHIHIYTPNSARAWKDLIIAQAVPHKGAFNKAVKIEIIYYLKRPKSLMRKSDSCEPIPHIKKPDLDNLNKAVLDALTVAGIWEDDR